MTPQCFFVAVSFVFVSVALAQTPAPDKIEVSDKTLGTLKALAWQSLPAKIVKNDQTVIEIDKSDPSQIVIPDADARSVIQEAHLTARAHKCNLQDLVIANRDALLLRERQTGRWSEGQLQYINTLHLFTVQLLLGNLGVVDAKPNASEPSQANCDEQEKQDILNAVEAKNARPGKS